jgi:iron(III) transport system substrate-binding protein
MIRKTSILLSAFAAVLMSTSALAETELTVYTAIEAEDLQRYADAFNADHPDIKINWVRDSTGVVTAKLLAEIITHRPMWSGAWPRPRCWY